MAKHETPVTHTRLSPSLLSNLPTDSHFEFFGSRLTVRIQWEGERKAEVRFFKTIDTTHWVEIVEGGRDGGVMHSAQMQSWLQDLLSHRRLLGFRLMDKDSFTLFEIGSI